MTRRWDRGNSWAPWEGRIWQCEGLGGVWGLGWVSATDKPQVKSYKKPQAEWAEFQGPQRASRERHTMGWPGPEGPWGEMPGEEVLSSLGGWGPTRQHVLFWWLGLHINRRGNFFWGEGYIFHAAGLKYKPLVCSLPFSLFIFLFSVSTVAVCLALTGSA